MSICILLESQPEHREKSVVPEVWNQIREQFENVKGKGNFTSFILVLVEFACPDDDSVVL